MNEEVFEKILICLLPYSALIFPVLPIIGEINYMYLLFLLFYIIQKFKVNRLANVKIEVLSVILIFMYSFSSLLWTPNLQQGISSTLAYFTGFIFMFAIVMLVENKQTDLFMKSIVITTNIMLVVAIIEMLFGTHLFVNNPEFMNSVNNYGFTYPLVFFSNTNDLAYTLVILIPLIAVYSYSKKKNTQMVILTLVSIIVVFNTESRLALLSLCATLAIIIVFMVLKDKKQTKKLLLGIAMTSLVFVCYTLIFDINIVEFLQIENLFIVDTSADYTTGRAEIIADAIKIGIETFPFGIGVAGTTQALMIPTHNMFIELWSDFAIIGFILFMLFYCSIILKYIKLLIVKKGNYYIETITILAILITFFLSNNISSGAGQRKITWLLFGVALLYIKNSYSNRNKEIKRENFNDSIMVRNRQ